MPTTKSEDGSDGDWQGGVSQISKFVSRKINKGDGFRVFLRQWLCASECALNDEFGSRYVSLAITFILMLIRSYADQIRVQHQTCLLLCPEPNARDPVRSFRPYDLYAAVRFWAFASLALLIDANLLTANLLTANLLTDSLIGRSLLLASSPSTNASQPKTFQNKTFQNKTFQPKIS